MTHRRINPTLNPLPFDHLIMQGLSHAMQPLKLKVRGALLSGTMQNGRDGMGVMGGKLRVNPIGHGQQLGRATDIIDICMRFGCKNWEARKAFYLHQFNLRVPISTFDQSHHNAAIQPFGQVIKPIDHMGGPLAISLHHDTKTVPTREARLRQNSFNHIQRQIQPRRFLCIYIQSNARRFSQKGQ